MNVHVTDWQAHYKQIQRRIRYDALPARVRLGAIIYDAPIGPDRARPATLYGSPIGPVRMVFNRDVLIVTTPETTQTKFHKIRDEELAKAGVSLEQFFGDARMRYVTDTRRIIWERAIKETKLSIAHIGRLSGKDHTTILAAMRRAAEIETGIKNHRLEANRARSNRRYQARKASAAVSMGA